MKANELQIGDWVRVLPISRKVEAHNSQVGALTRNVNDTMNIEGGYFPSWRGWSVSEEYIEPIPLTAEILEANGFDIIEEIAVYHSDGTIGEGMWQNDCLCCGYDNTKGQFEFYTFSFDPEEDDIICQIKHILFVHELQHALRLCGLDDLADNFKVEYLQNEKY